MAVIPAFAQDALDRAEPLTVAAAYAQCRAAALAESVIGAVGLEIESHLVDLDHVADPVPWKRIEAIAAVVGKVTPGSAVTVEPGGQIELSGPPEAGVAPAVARLRFEGTGARLALADRRLGLAYAGADPARPSRRVNPRAAFTGAPSVSAHQVLGAGHNIDHHHAGSQYRHDVLDWAENLPAREETTRAPPRPASQASEVWQSAVPVAGPPTRICPDAAGPLCGA